MVVRCLYHKQASSGLQYLLSRNAKKVVCLHKQHEQRDLGESWMMTRGRIFFFYKKTIPYPVNISKSLKIL